MQSESRMPGWANGFSMQTDMRHLDASTLALLIGGELPLLTALRSRWHIHSCENCARELARFRSARSEIGNAFGADWQRANPDDPATDTDPAWQALEAEMRANIRLGLTAGSLAEVSLAGGASGSNASEEVTATSSAMPWRWAAVCAALVFVFIAGWSLRVSDVIPASVAFAPIREDVVAPPAARIQLLVPVADVSRTETDFDGSTRSRVFDRETGQVTLQQVYVE